YIGPAPIEGTDDRQLIATLRDGEPAPAPSGVRRPLLADLFRPTPIPRRGAPTPQERPYDLGDEDRGADLPLLRTRTYAARMTTPSELSGRPEAPEESRTSPVSAFAPMRYDGTQAVATGRGLY